MVHHGIPEPEAEAVATATAATRIVRIDTDHRGQLLGGLDVSHPDRGGRAESVMLLGVRLARPTSLLVTLRVARRRRRSLAIPGIP